ncbi:uncharacterized protein LAESUDRAFT_761316 [Laetiporus sulphureus 93-53]|uniref:Uncharacterized protein n=1 Tax=Laetiporus sulphureus 93-53 TaxID=1314785 RepID=A0A165D5P9_9APHY|nr:uncharacterized protein LAESUDRAFT_761316 [Laetiporus sulphureus 93-53]KZT04196.1 hypothetical protein LAESUDRAFT_761316 [Laetiporus sulphureus 93-53]
MQWVVGQWEALGRQGELGVKTMNRQGMPTINDLATPTTTAPRTTTMMHPRMDHNLHQLTPSGSRSASPYDVFITMPLTFLMECDGHRLYVHCTGTGDFATFHAFVFTWDNQKVTWHLYSEDSPHRVFSQWVTLLYPPPIPGMHDCVHFAGKEEGVEQYEVKLFRTFSDQVHCGDTKTPCEFMPVIFQPLVAMIEWPGWLTDGVEALKAVLYEDGSISHWAPTEFYPQPQEDLDDGWEVIPHTTIPVYDYVGVRGGR